MSTQVWVTDRMFRAEDTGGPGCKFRVVKHEDHLAAVAALEQENRAWLKENAPGGWIDSVRQENKRLKALLREYHSQHYDINSNLCAHDEFGDTRCDLCKRTDRELEQ